MGEQWYKVFASLAEAQARIPSNQVKLVIIKGKKICLAHSTTGFYAIGNACPHRGASLSDGKINHLGEIVCPLHSYRYRLTDGRACEGLSDDAQTYPVLANHEGFFIKV